MKLIIGIVFAFLIVIAFILLAIFLNNKAKKEQERAKDEIDNLIQQKSNSKVKRQTQKTYSVKNQYVSNCELEFYRAIKSIIKDKYLIFPQVPLSQIIIKNEKSLYQNELYRIIDFCIFSKDYRPLVCIEINDKTHKEFNRINRDKKVKNILEQAELPLITLWTEYGVNVDYIANRLRKILQIDTI